MNHSDAVRICRWVAAALPQQRMDAATPDVWAELFADLRYVDAQEAVVRLAKRQTWVSAADIVSEVKVIRNRRLAENPIIEIPSHLRGREYVEWMRERTRRVMDGDTRPEIES